uniref:Integrin alpha-M-like n=1 Tax=Sinocyclocheilus grahami TaxID=75366 RepID=A0A672NI54_SINGR
NFKIHLKTCHFTFFYMIVCHSLTAFNIDPVTWKTFTNNENTGFGYKVIQKGASLLVSDPLIQHSQTQRGQIYDCSVISGNCVPLAITVPAEAINMSLGLSMSLDPQSSRAVCGPTIPKNCDVTTYNGMCFKISSDNIDENMMQFFVSLTSECPKSQIDIAFLMDGSGSVNYADFNKMKAFVIEMIKSFLDHDTQFAIAQFSTNCNIHYKFKQSFKNAKSWEDAVNKISQDKGWTNTAKAIEQLLFVSEAGARPSASKILVVITDGESTDYFLAEAVQQAHAKSITRYAIGVGNAFDIDKATRELAIIASLPTNKHVFKVTDFDALESIREQLKENIIAIEGTQTSGDSSRMEFSQDGFSAALTSTVIILTYLTPVMRCWSNIHQIPQNILKSVLFTGYSLAIVTMFGAKYAVMGAPRYKHKGQVSVSRIDNIRSNLKELDPPKPQIGSYFGAEVCVVDLNSDSRTDLLLVSAPTYMEPDREGKVFVYTISRRSYFIFSGMVLVGMAGQRGRFGSSLASPADLNNDGYMDVLIGAPLEEDGQGSIYIFNGGVDQINSAYSQRIAGSSVRPGLRFFGISLSQSSLDQTQDSLPDIAVGSKGAVLLLRSRPIMHLETRVTYNPSKIPTGETDQSLKNTMKVCFTMSPHKHSIRANINYTIMLDAKRQKYRAYFSPKNRFHNNDTTIKFYEETCKSHPFLIDAFSEDALNSLSNQLTFTFEGLPSAKLQNIRPILLPGIKTTTDHNLDFEINCGHDDICVDDLRMDFSFSGSTNIEVGIMQEIDVAVIVENRGENSYNTFFTLNYPFGLSYRRITSKQGRVECVSLDSEQKGTFGKTTCHISKPILKGNAQILSKKSIGVKYAIYIALIRLSSMSLFLYQCIYKNGLFQVENDFRELSFKVFIRVPVMLGDKSIWTNKNIQIPGCVKQRDERPVVTDFVEVIKKDRVVNCSVAVCAEFSCDVTLIKNERIKFISQNEPYIHIFVSSFFLMSRSVSLRLDSEQLFSIWSVQHLWIMTRINTQVEVYEEVNLTKEIAGGVIGGLLLLALLTAALYKAGFFKSQYKQLLEDAEESPEEGPTTK